MKQPTLFKVKLLVNTFYNSEGEILKIKKIDENNIYYYDNIHRWCHLEKDLEGISYIRLHSDKDLI